ISNQKRKASKENNCIYNHKIQLFEDLKKIFEFTNVDNSSGFAFYRNFQDKRKESVKEIKRKEIDELNEEITTLNDQYLNEAAENEKMRLQIEELIVEITKLDLDKRDLQNKFDRSNTKSTLEHTIIGLSLWNQLLSAQNLIISGTVLTIIGYIFWDKSISKTDPAYEYKRWKTAKGPVLFFVTLLGLSPILKTLTKDTSSDTIWALTVILFLANMLFHDYGSENRTK
ncbi:33638_t:CDS:2, partial [Gigaspora margarita]